jgi:hypothetical protein
MDSKETKIIHSINIIIQKEFCTANIYDCALKENFWN